MSHLLTVFCLLSSVLYSAGCISSGVRPETADTVSAIIRPVAKNLVNLVLAKNPKYEQALLALAGGAEIAAHGGTLTPEGIKAFVDTLALKYEIDAETKLVIASALDDVFHAYQDLYGQRVVDATDPNVRKYLAAFATGIREGIAFRRAIATP